MRSERIAEHPHPQESDGWFRRDPAGRPAHFHRVFGPCIKRGSGIYWEVNGGVRAHWLYEEKSK